MCNCKCNCNHSSDRDLQSIYSELERKNPTSILTGKGMYEQMQDQKERKRRSEERESFRRRWR